MAKQEEKLTEWFNGSVKPMRVGVYQRRDWADLEDHGYSYWDGKNWGVLGDDPDDAMVWARAITNYPELPWRGLARRPR